MKESAEVLAGARAVTTEAGAKASFCRRYSGISLVWSARAQKLEIHFQAAAFFTLNPPTPLPDQHPPSPTTHQQRTSTPRSTCASSASTPPPPCRSWLPCDGLTSTVCAYDCQRHCTPSDAVPAVQRATTRACTLVQTSNCISISPTIRYTSARSV